MTGILGFAGWYQHVLRDAAPCLIVMVWLDRDHRPAQNRSHRCGSADGPVEPDHDDGTRSMPRPLIEPDHDEGGRSAQVHWPFTASQLSLV